MATPAARHRAAGVAALLCAVAALAAGEVPPERQWEMALGQAGVLAVTEPEAVAPFVALASRAVRERPAADARFAALFAAAAQRRIFFTPERLPGEATVGVVEHRIAAGERLESIAKRYRMTARWLAALNPQVTPNALRAGGRLKAVDMAAAPVEVVVSREHFLLMIWRGDLLLFACQVGLGTAERPTPHGETTIALSVANPEWRDPATGKVHKPGAPGNILGGWWLGFAPGPDGRFKGIGMHGYTGAPSADWMGKPGSRGCVRLKQEDLALVSAVLLPGTRVSVR